MREGTKEGGTWLALGLCVMFAPWSGARGEDGTLNVSALILNGTCAVTASPGAISFDPVGMGRFTRPGQTAQVKPLQITLSGCRGIGGGAMSAAVRVNGAGATFDPALFLDPSSTTQGVGVMLRAGEYTGALGNFYDANQAVRTGDYTFGRPAGQVMTDGNQDYSVGLTNGNGQQAVRPGNLTATLQFTFLYH